MDATIIIEVVAVVAVVGLAVTLARHKIYRMFHSPAEICEKYEHSPGVMTETCGRGRFGTCECCRAPLYEREFS